MTQFKLVPALPTEEMEKEGDGFLDDGGCAITIYRAMLAAAPSPWIPVSERLPEIVEFGPGSVAGMSELVLTVAPDGGYTIQRYRRGGRGDLTTEYWSDDDDVTHWMPMIPGPAESHE